MMGLILQPFKEHSKLIDSDCMYMFKFQCIMISISDNETVTLDIHFRRSTMVKYRTNVVFDWMDLMGLKFCHLILFCICCFVVFIVAYGGIAGLFLGCSLLSVTEIVIYVGILIAGYIKKCYRIFLRLRNRNVLPM